MPDGEPVPFEVDHAALRERIWPWLVAPGVGVLFLIGAAIVSNNRPSTALQIRTSTEQVSARVPLLSNRTMEIP